MNVSVKMLNAIMQNEKESRNGMGYGHVTVYLKMRAGVCGVYTCPYLQSTLFVHAVSSFDIYNIQYTIYH